MAFNGSGTFNLAAGNPVVSGTTISSTVHNNTLSEIAAGLSTCVLKDGQQTLTAAIPFNSQRLTGLGDATAVTDAAKVSQVQNSAYINVGSVSGTNTITGTLSPTPAAYASGQLFLFKPANDNTGATTVNWNSLGAKSAKWNGAALTGGELNANVPALVRYNGTDFDLLSNPKQGIGKQTIWVPAAAMTPTVSNGCAVLTETETTAGRPDMQTLDFGNGSDEHAQFQVAFPKSWDEGTVTFQAFWTTTNTGTEGVAWGLQGVAVSDNGTIDVAYGTAVVVTDDNQGAAEDLLVTAESSAVTIAGTPAAADVCFFRVFRDVSDANDDMTEDARLLGIKLLFTTDAANDA